VKNAAEIVYRMALLGMFVICSDGRVWRYGTLKTNKRKGTCRFVRQKLEPIPSIMYGRHKRPEVNVWCLYTSATVGAHRLVYRAFVGFALYGHDIHHRDMNSANNHPDNLQMLTRRRHTDLHMATPGIALNVPPAKVRQICRMLESGVQKKVIAQKLHIGRKTVAEIAKRAERRRRARTAEMENEK